MPPTILDVQAEGDVACGAMSIFTDTSKVPHNTG